MNSSVQPGISSTATGVSRRQLRALLREVEAAEGPDRRLSARLSAALLSSPAEPMKAVAMRGRGPWPSCGRPWFVVGASGTTYAERWLTRSIDEALCMVDHFFPDAQTAIYTGWALKRHGTEIEPGHWSIPNNAPRGCWVRFYGGAYLGPLYNARCEAANTPLAIMGALLHALILQDMQDTQAEPPRLRYARADWNAMMGRRLADTAEPQVSPGIDPK